MIVEIKGIGIPNKGAELMLVAVLEALKQKYKQVTFVVDPNTDFLGRCRFGLYQKAWMNVKGIQLGYLLNFMPQKLLSRFGLVRDKDIDVIIDASGFCYSDSFGFENANEQVGRYIKKWRNSGKKYVFLPQAYGPFEDKKLAALMRSTLMSSNLFFARDKVSKEYLENILSVDVKQFPDFTCAVKGVLPTSFNPAHAGDVCIIINNRMVEKHSKEDGARYIANMEKMIASIRNLGGEPYFLLHEGQDDVLLTDKINRNLANPLETFFFDDPLHIKGVIGTARLVISSRFHGLVSALTQGVPVLATGWSHKYQMLLEDYDCSELLMDHLQIENIDQKLEFIFKSENYSDVVKRINVRLEEQICQTRNMWAQVFSVLA